MKVNFGALKDISVASLKIVGWGFLFSLFSGVCGFVTAPFGLIGAAAELGFVGVGILLFYPPIKRNFDKLVFGTKQLKNNGKNFVKKESPINSKTKEKSNQYTGSYGANQSSEKQSLNQSKPSYQVHNKEVNISIKAHYNGR